MISLQNRFADTSHLRTWLCYDSPVGEDHHEYARVLLKKQRLAPVGKYTVFECRLQTGWTVQAGAIRALGYATDSRQ